MIDLHAERCLPAAGERREAAGGGKGLFLAALRRGTRARPGFFDVMAFYIGRAPCDELGERSPGDHACWTKQGWLDKGRRCCVPVNPVHHAPGAVVE